MSFSFCIITGGSRPEILRTVLASIRGQGIADYEIIVSGRHAAEPGLIYVPAAEAAAAGRLSVLRNLGVAKARYEHIVILDDDVILAPDWYQAFRRYDRPFDILTSQVRVPDGSRYFDHATVGGPRGHRILRSEEEDDFVYMTGGGGWVMKAAVARAVQWNEHKTYYQEEDVDFSRRCQARGFGIAHHHGMLVFHADPSYTGIGRVVARRRDGRSQQWIQTAFADASGVEILRRMAQFRKAGCFAEAADLARMARIRGPARWFFSLLWRLVEAKMGGRLPDVDWYPGGDPAYLEALERFTAEP
ncbi:MAG: glycosyltransferase family A protein [Desulfuromonadaceae bacterium]